MPLSNLNRHIELCTRRLELADQALLATAAGNYEEADRIDREIEEITRQIEELNKKMDEEESVMNQKQKLSESAQEIPKVYCPDCGAKLKPAIFEQFIAPFPTYVIFHCPGRCLLEAFRNQGIDSATVTPGFPKFSVELKQGIEHIDINVAIAQAATVIARKRAKG